MSASYEVRKALFDAFVRDNPHIYGELVARARRAKERGHRLGMRCLWEALRYDWSVSVRHDKDAPRLNDWFAPLYARLIAKQEPDLADYFELRDRTNRVADPDSQPALVGGAA